MTEFFLELLAEEMPARLQAPAAENLARLVQDALAPLRPEAVRTWFGPRRLALVAAVAAGVAETRHSERGPRRAAPEQALAGFLRKHGATAEALRADGDFWVLDRVVPGTDAASLIAGVLPGLLRRFPWPKSMRWDGGDFTWVRPLRRILCLLGGEAVRFELPVEAAGKPLQAGVLTEGHRFHAPGPVPVASVADWLAVLRERRVLASGEEREQAIETGVAALAARQGLRVVADPGLVAEVAGLVEWPVPLLGRIDARFMDLPPEVIQVSMRVNQRYFALRDEAGTAAPWFAFAANIEAQDGGAAIVAGNERVLRARLSDARHFWDTDRQVKLADRVRALDGIVFHADLGTQGERVRRLVRLARFIAPLVGADSESAARAALLAKADLTTGMVGEFPELQGVMGGYYAAADGENPAAAAAIGEHYAPRGPSDTVPSAPVSVALALADKIDQIAAFFSVGHKPSGSGDPYALRRAALGVIRIVRDREWRIGLAPVLAEAAALMAFSLHSQSLPAGTAPETVAAEMQAFILERLRVQVRAEGARHDVLASVMADGDDDLVRLLRRSQAVADLLATAAGARLLGAYRRGANILRIENAKDGPHRGDVDPAAMVEPAERRLFAAIGHAERARSLVAAEDFAGAAQALAGLCEPVDAFFADVTVNAADPALRVARLRLLDRLRQAIDALADFSTIEG